MGMAKPASQLQSNASERWLWRLVTAGLVALAASLVLVGFTLYV